MTIVLDPSVLDGGANNLALANKILICSSVPTTYAGANTATLGTKNLGIGNVFGPKTNWNSGRCIFSTPIVDGVVSSTGDVVCWAVVDDANSRLLATGPVAPGTVHVISGKAFALNSFGIYLLGKGSTDTYDVAPNHLTRCHYNGGVISDDAPVWGNSGGPVTFAINAGRFGDGIYIDTDTASEARCGDNSILTPRRGTISLWAKPTTNTDFFTMSGGGQAPYMGGGITVGPSGEFHVQLTPGSNGGMENQQYFSVGSGTIDIPINAQHFFAWTWQGAHHKLYHGKLGDPALALIADQIMPSPFVPATDMASLGFRLAGYGHAVVMDEFETENFAATFAELNAKFLAGSGAPVPILEAHGLDAQVLWLPGEGAGYVMLEAGNAFATRVDHAVVDFYCSGVLITTVTVSGFVTGWAASKVAIEAPLRPGAWVATVSLYTATNILLTRQNSNSYTLPSTVWLGNNYGSLKAGTVLLLHMDGVNGSTTFTDATGRHSILKWATAAIDTSTSVFGGGSMHSDGTGFLLNIFSVNGDLNLGTGDFTVDLRVRLANIGVAQYRMWGGLGFDVYYDNAANVFTFYTSAVGVIAVSSAVAANQWYHLAVTRSSGQSRFFVNGVQQGTTYADNANYAFRGELTIAASTTGGASALNGWMDEFRIVKGVAVWTANFTPPTSAYVLPSALQPPWTPIVVTNVPPVLLLHMDGTNGSTTFTDATSKHTVAVAGSAQIGTAQSKFGGASALFTKAGNASLLLDGSSDFVFGTGDFTVDFLFMPTLALQFNTIFDWTPFQDGSNPSPAFGTASDGSLTFNTGSSVSINGPVLSLNVWHHIALTRASGISRLFVDGSQVGADTTDINNYVCGANRPILGHSGYWYGLNGTGLDGWIDEVRVIKGNAVWTSNFTPPTSAYSSAPPVVSVWGRDCTLGINGLPTQIASQGKNLLSVPVSTDIDLGAGIITWTDGSLTFDSIADDKVAWTGTSTSSGILRTVKGSIEYDGLMQFDVTLAPTGGAVTISTIKQNTKMPVARALYFSNGLSPGFTRTYDPTVPTATGTFLSNTVFPVCPSYVLSDDDVGLEWWCESTNNWCLNRSSTTTPYQRLLVDGSGNVVIENSFANVSFSLAAATTFSFGLMATPVKDLPSTWRFWQVGGTSGNSAAIPGTYDIFWVFPGDGRRNGGAIWPSFHECPDNLTDLEAWITNTSPATSPVSWAPFFNQHLVLASRDPSVDGGDSDTWPLAIETQGDNPGWQWQITQGARDYRAYCQHWMQTAGSTNALQARYTDEPFIVYNKSRWPWNGGSILPDGTTVSGYNLLGQRKDFQRLRQGMLDYPATSPNGVIWVNGSTPQMVPHGLSHVTIVSDGEGLTWSDPTDSDPIGSWGANSIIGMQWLRGMSRTKKFGFVQFFLDYINFSINTYPTQHIAFWKALVSCLLIHDIPVVSRNVGYCNDNIWTAFTSFGMTGAAVFHGYWTQTEITAATTHVFISYWLKTNSVLAVIANHTSSVFSGNVTFNAGALGLTGGSGMGCKNANTGASIAISSNQITVSVPSHDYLLVQFDGGTPGGDTLREDGSFALREDGSLELRE